SSSKYRRNPPWLESVRERDYVPPSMDKQAVRRTLDQLAAFLELQGGNAARVRAVRHAARSELLATGRSSALDELREQVSPGLAEMLRIPGLGGSGLLRVEIAGVVRRRCEVIEALDLVAVHEGQAARETLVPRLGRAYGVTETAGRGGNVTLRFASGTVVDVLLTTPERFGLDWIRAT